MKKLQTKYEKFIHYAIATCDSFTLIDDLEMSDKKYRAVLQALNPFLLKQQYLDNDWNPDTGTPFIDANLNFYRCCPATERILLKKDSTFDWARCNGLPEELCFYRGDQNWYYCIPHERLDGFKFMTDEDLQFFKEEKIVVYQWEDEGHWCIDWNCYY